MTWREESTMKAFCAISVPWRKVEWVPSASRSINLDNTFPNSPSTPLIGCRLILISLEMQVYAEHCQSYAYEGTLSQIASCTARSRLRFQENACSDSVSPRTRDFVDLRGSIYGSSGRHLTLGESIQLVDTAQCHFLESRL
jgi:hypothetical protein